MNADSITLMQVLDDILTAHMRLTLQDANLKARELLNILLQMIPQERVSAAIINSIVVADITSSQFFEILRQDWYSLEGRKETLVNNPMYPSIKKLNLEEDGIVSLPDNKLMCVGCGGIATAVPKYLTAMHLLALFDPSCPSILRDMAECEKSKGTIINDEPDILEVEVLNKCRKLQENGYHLYNGDMVTIAERVKTFRQLDKPNIGSLRRLAEAGWFVVLTPRGLITKRFCCGGEFSEWSPGKCPWMEHFCLFPTCPYLHMMFGEQEIKSILAGHAERVKYSIWPITILDAFQKIMFPASMVNYERPQWDLQ